MEIVHLRLPTDLVRSQSSFLYYFAVDRPQELSHILRIDWWRWDATGLPTIYDRFASESVSRSALRPASEFIRALTWKYDIKFTNVFKFNSVKKRQEQWRKGKNYAEVAVSPFPRSSRLCGESHRNMKKEKKEDQKRFIRIHLLSQLLNIFTIDVIFGHTHTKSCAFILLCSSKLFSDILVPFVPFILFIRSLLGIRSEFNKLVSLSPLLRRKARVNKIYLRQCMPECVMYRIRRHCGDNLFSLFSSPLVRMLFVA